MQVKGLECTTFSAYQLGFRNQNPRHGKTSHLLGESTPPQGVNSLIIPDLYLLDLWR
jgi:hypothetical protein